MELIIYPLLCRESQKAMTRTKLKSAFKWGDTYNYEPNGRLLKRLSVKLQMSKDEVRARIIQEREYLLRNKQQYNQFE